jgi:hypothetical protein
LDDLYGIGGVVSPPSLRGDEENIGSHRKKGEILRNC